MSVRRRSARAIAAGTALALVPALFASVGTASATTTARAALVAPALVSYDSAQARISTVLPVRVAKLPALDKAPGIYVSDAWTGSVAYRRNATAPMRSASTMKLVTAASTLRLLGTDHRFPTRVVTGRAPLEVVLVGGGDPLLTSAQLTGLARRTAVALAARAPAAPAPGSTAGTPAPFTVSVRLDDTLYAPPSAASGWRDTYVPTEVAPVRPLIRDLRNEWDGAKSTAVWFTGKVQTELRALLAARTDLAPAATYAGRRAATPDATEVARTQGSTTADVLRYMLLWSDNDVAEMMFRNNAIAADHSATWNGGIATALETLAALKVDTTGWIVRDGSGLSRYDRVTAQGLSQLLRRAVSPKHPALKPLRSYLPVGGVSGTLQKSYGRYDTSPTSCAVGRVWGKTGSLFDTISLAGYSLGADGRLKVFTVLVHRTSYAWSGLTVRRSADRVAATATGCY